MKGDLPPSLHEGKPTLLFIEVQMVENFGINPLEYFLDKNSSWQSDYGEALKVLLIAYHQLKADEEKRIHDEMKEKRKNN